LQPERSLNKRRAEISYQTKGYVVAAFKDPTFQDRVASAGKAKQQALDLLKAKPRVDEAVMAERRRVREAREKDLSEERARKAVASAAAKAEKLAIKEAELAAAKTASELKEMRLRPASAADMKAARDARYAARKARK
jgi:hypothetical protein